VLADLDAGRPRSDYADPGGAAPESIAFDRSIFRGKRYLPLAPVQAHRGCRYHCSFCSVHALHGSRITTRPADRVQREIRQIRSRLFLFVDDNLFASRRDLDELLQALSPLRPRFVCQISVDAAWEPDLPQRLAEAGCLAVYVGFESMDRQNLAQMGKAANLGHRDYHEAIRLFRDAGLMVCGSFVFGNDRDTPAAVRAAYEFGLEERLFLCHFNLLFPVPGTALYQRLLARGQLIYPRWWTDPRYRYGRLPFRPVSAAAEELERICARVRREFNSMRSLVRRCRDLEANMKDPLRAGIFFLANLANRREVVRKGSRSLD
jgi:radical SAM superfamily enzyme YgiQ (UPF0313 family)